MSKKADHENDRHFSQWKTMKRTGLLDPYSSETTQIDVFLESIRRSAHLGGIISEFRLG